MCERRTGAINNPGIVRIGISGWRYAPWRGVFFPEKLPRKDDLRYAAERFRTIEINGSFYSLQRPESYARWAEATPPDFVFAVKGSRYITHMLKLRNVEAALANFFASGVLRLGPKLGPILWQFPPSFRFDPARLEPFLAALPRDTEAALQIARRHDHRMSGRAWLEIDRSRALRHAVEIRHRSFVDPEFVALLRRHKVALVCADTVAWPRLMDLTADFVYCRLHGSKELYASGYGAKALDGWAARVAAWARGHDAPDGERVIATPGPKRARRDVFVYFDNDMKVRAPPDAAALARRVAKLLGA